MTPYYFSNGKALDWALRRVKSAAEARAIEQSLESRQSPSGWITKALNRYYQLCEEE